MEPNLEATGEPSSFRCFCTLNKYSAVVCTAGINCSTKCTTHSTIHYIARQTDIMNVMHAGASEHSIQGDSP